jgi:hypothetical protein
MSGKRARELRRAPAQRALHIVNSEYAKASADRVLSVDLSGVPVSRTTQFIVGWLRSVFEQSRAIACLTTADLAHTAAPNRRNFVEVIVRLQWLHGMPQPDRAGALDAMIDHERETTRKAFKNLSELGYDIAVDLSDMEAMILEATSNGTIKNQARKFFAAAESTMGKSGGLYYAWRGETQYTHATGALAASYAPDVHDVMGHGKPPVADPDLEIHRLGTVLAVTLVYDLLVDEGVDADLAMTIFSAFFGNS